MSAFSSNTLVMAGLVPAIHVFLPDFTGAHRGTTIPCGCSEVCLRRLKKNAMASEDCGDARAGKGFLDRAAFFFMWAAVVFGLRPLVPEWTRGLDLLAIVPAAAAFFFIWSGELWEAASECGAHRSDTEAHGAAFEPAQSNAGLPIGLIRVVAWLAAVYLVTVAVDTWVAPYFGDSQLEPLLIKLCLSLLFILAIKMWLRPKSAPSAR